MKYIIISVLVFATFLTGFFLLKNDDQSAIESKNDFHSKKSSYPSRSVSLQGERKRIAEDPESKLASSFRDRLAQLELQIKNSRNFNEWREEFYVLASENPEALLYLLAELKAPYPRDDAQGTLLYEWALRDYTAANSWVLDNFEGLELQSIRSDLIAVIIESDLERADGLLQEFSGGHAKNQLVNLFVKKMFRDDPASTLEWINSNLLGLQKNLALESLGDKVLGNGDIEKGLEHLERFTPGSNRDNFLRKVADEYARGNYSKSTEWFDGMDLIDRKEVLQVMASAFLEKDSELAFNFIRENGDKDGADLESFLKRWGRISPSDSLKMIDSRSDSIGEVSVNARAQVVHSWSMKQPEKAAEYVRGVQDRGMQPELLAHLASGWAGSDPQAAADFLLTFDPEVNERGISILTGFWSQFDSLQAGEWIAGLEQGRTQDVASAKFAKSMATADPAGAAEWSLSISNPIVRAKALKNVLRSWKKTDPEGAALFESNLGD